MGNVCVGFGAACLTTALYHVGVQPPTFCISQPPPHFLFLFLLFLTKLSGFLQKNFTLQFVPSPQLFLSIFQLFAAAVVLSFWWKTGYQSLSPQLHTFKFRPPHLQGTFKLGIKHCTWQRFPDPAQTIIKFLCLRTCWTQTLFSLAREANLLLQINIKQTDFFFNFRNKEARTFSCSHSHTPCACNVELFLKIHSCGIFLIAIKQQGIL